MKQAVVNTINDFIYQKCAVTIAVAAKGNPALGTLTVFIFYLMVSFFEAQVERVIWGAGFPHVLDPIIALLFIILAAATVWACAVMHAPSLSGTEEDK